MNCTFLTLSVNINHFNARKMDPRTLLLVSILVLLPQQRRAYFRSPSNRYHLTRKQYHKLCNISPVLISEWIPEVSTLISRTIIVKKSFQNSSRNQFFQFVIEHFEPDSNVYWLRIKLQVQDYLFVDSIHPGDNCTWTTIIKAFQFMTHLTIIEKAFKE